MPVELSAEQARLLRVRAQCLTGDEVLDASVADTVRNCCGLQAQDAGQAPLSIRARCRGVTAGDVQRARFEDRSIARTWSMRGTRHYVATEDLSWLRSLFGPLYVDRGQRRLTQLGLDEADCERAMAMLRDALQESGPHTRDEIASQLLDEGFDFDPDGQATIHVVRRACLAGIAVEAAPRDGQETYALLDDWLSIDTPPDRAAALTELARRYVAAHEPATVDDFYSWSGLYKRDVRTGWQAIEDDLIEVEVAGERAWIASNTDVLESIETPNVRLLPMYDSYFLGHEARDLVLPEAYADRVFPGGGVIRSTVVVDGLAAGTWKLDRSQKTALLRVEPFEAVESAVEAEIESEAASVGNFFDTDCTVEIAS